MFPCTICPSCLFLSLFSFTCFFNSNSETCMWLVAWFCRLLFLIFIYARSLLCKVFVVLVAASDLEIHMPSFTPSILNLIQHFCWYFFIDCCQSCAAIVQNQSFLLLVLELSMLCHSLFVDGHYFACYWLVILENQISDHL